MRERCQLLKWKMRDSYKGFLWNLQDYEVLWKYIPKN